MVGDCAADGVTGLLDVESVAAVATGLLAVDAVVSAALVAVESSAALAVFFSGSVVSLSLINGTCLISGSSPKILMKCLLFYLHRLLLSNVQVIQSLSYVHP